MRETPNLIGAVTTIVIYCLYILLFGFRIIGLPKLGHWLASLQFLSVLPFVYLLFTVRKYNRPVIFIIQVLLFLTFLVLELIIDYLFKFDFRQTRWMVIAYVTYFFAASGGLLGLVALMENRIWTILGVGLFLVMGAMAFISRAVTGI